MSGISLTAASRPVCAKRSHYSSQYAVQQSSTIDSNLPSYSDPPAAIVQCKSAKQLLEKSHAHRMIYAGQFDLKFFANTKPEEIQLPLDRSNPGSRNASAGSFPVKKRALPDVANPRTKSAHLKRPVTEIPSPRRKNIIEQAIAKRQVPMKFQKELIRQLSAKSLPNERFDEQANHKFASFNNFIDSRKINKQRHNVHKVEYLTLAEKRQNIISSQLNLQQKQQEDLADKMIKQVQNETVTLPHWPESVQQTYTRFVQGNRQQRNVGEFPITEKSRFFRKLKSLEFNEQKGFTDCTQKDHDNHVRHMAKLDFLKAQQAQKNKRKLMPLHKPLKDYLEQSPGYQTLPSYFTVNEQAHLFQAAKKPNYFSSSMKELQKSQHLAYKTLF